jgi:hypothetical protein
VARGTRLLGVLLVVIAAGGLAVAFAHGPRGRHHPHISAKGALRISNSLNGRAILTAPNLAPGESASGQVTVRNVGGQRGRLRLVQRIVSERPGAGGGLLSRQLQLTIDRMNGVRVYAGPIGEMRKRNLGRVGRKRRRTYAFHVQLPEATDDPYQGASLTVDYRWRLRAPKKHERR